MPTTPQTKKIAFVDTSVSGYKTLLNGFDASTEVVLISGGDGLQQMADAVAGLHDLDAIYVVSHGSAGALQIGSTRLDGGNLNQHSNALAALGAALAAQGDLLLYGCNIAQGTAGQALVSALAVATGADVAASDDLTGAASLGGNWVLEQQSGVIETTLWSAQSFNGVLAAPVVTSTAVTSVNAGAPYSYAPKATDADNDLLAWTVKTGTSLPAGLTLSSTMVVSTLAGQAPATSPGISNDARANGGFVDGTGSAARFKLPYGFTIDSQGNLFVADWENDAIRKVTPAGVVTTFATFADAASEPKDVAIGPGGILYVADTGKDVIYQLDSSGNRTVYAGVEGSSGTTDSITRLSAKFDNPNSIAFYHDSGTDYMYVADRNNNQIRVINMSTGIVSTLATGFDQATGVSVDSRGDVFVADRGNGTETNPTTGYVKKITTTTATTGTVTTIATLLDGTA
ncbi:MAG: DUF4347 domain-containing protein, partial [Rhodoferax sp.]